MRLLFISLEFTAGTFSGNGVYAASQVRALAGLGHKILVIAGKPPNHDLAPEASGACSLLEVELPTWGCLDISSAWQEFADGAAGYAEQVVGFEPQAVLGVDWTSLRPYQTLAVGLIERGHRVLPYVFMSYRVYLRTAEGRGRDFMHRIESEAVSTAVLVTVLSRSDAAYIVEHLPLPGGRVARPVVLLPALRADLALLPLPADALLTGSAGEPAQTCTATAPRLLLTCCVRLSPEKEPGRFVDVVKCLAAKGELERLQVMPLLLGSAQSPYACELRDRFRASWVGVRVEERFLGPADLAHIYAQTRLNYHPCLYDAYGMTIVEAASQGTPSVFNRGGCVGAGDLLSAARQEAVELDLTQPAPVIAKHLAALLSNPGALAEVGAAAAARARSWSGAANAAALAAMVEKVI